MIEYAKIEQLQEILKLYNKNGKALGRYFKQDVIDAIESNQWFVDIENNKIVAFCSYEIKKRLKRIVITDLCVDIDYRKQHKATNLINFIKEKTKQLNMPYYAECLKGQENNAFYEKIGTLDSVREHETYAILVYKIWMNYLCDMTPKSTHVKIATKERHIVMGNVKNT